MFKTIFQVPVKKERLRETLPKPPAGMAWLQNPDTKEWKLVPEEEVTKKEEKLEAAHAVHEDPSEVTVDFEQSSRGFANPFGLPAPSPKEGDSSSSSPSRRVVVTLPEGRTFGSQDNGESKTSDEADWELLSDRASNSSHALSPHGIAFVSRTGSVSTKGSSLFHGGALKRTPSSSTIDSNDLMNLGPTGKGILGVDYVEHVILPTDTLQGICLAYKVSASRLKRANHFSGEGLLLAPKKIVIPISKQALRQGYLRVQDTDSKEYKMHAIQAEFPTLGLTEAKAYLELADWILKDAIRSAKEDNDWEKEVPNKGQLQPGEIRVMMNVQPHPEAGHLLNFSAQGAGYRNTGEEEKTSEATTPIKRNTKPVDPKSVEAKAVKVEDIHAASPTHNSYGLEMQSIPSNKKS